MSETRIVGLQRAIAACRSVSDILSRIMSDSQVGLMANPRALAEARQLEAELDRELSTITRLRNGVSSPISRLPDDVLMHILSTPPSEDWPGFPEAVSSVCCRWRNVALRTPALWQSIVIGVEPLQVGSRPRRAKLEAKRELLRKKRRVRNVEWLKRSYWRALSVRVLEAHPKEIEQLLGIGSAGTGVPALSIRRLYWNVPPVNSPVSSAMMELLSRVLASCCRSLHVLHMRTDITLASLSPKVENLLDAFPASVLRDVSLSSLVIPRNLGALQGCKSISLQYLQMHSSNKHLLQLLQTCPGLESLDVFRYLTDFSPSTLPQQAPQKRILMPHLTTLRLKKDDQPSDLLALIEAPRLEVLEVVEYHGYRTTVVHVPLCPTFTEFARISGSCLRGLSVRSPSADGLFEVLWHLPALHILSLSKLSINTLNDVLRKLAPHDGHSAAAPCPVLFHLRLDCSEPIISDPSELTLALYVFLRNRRVHPTMRNIYTLELTKENRLQLQQFTKRAGADVGRVLCKEITDEDGED